MMFKKTLPLIIMVLLLVSCKKELKKVKLSGSIFGTFYDINYFSEDNTSYQKEVDSLFRVINTSLSNYQEDSDISKVNKHILDSVDNHFINVFKASKRLYNETDGVFDPTIGKLVNAWNFGSEKNKTQLDSLKIDSLMRYVGLEKVSISGHKIVKQNPKPYLDFNAIAKGYAVDVIGEFIESKAIENYLINIGGELRGKGINIEKKSGWTVGIENPNFDGTQSYDEIFVLKNQSMATSGTYRKFKIDENGNKYAHIINTKTGYPTKTNILSVSVLARTCAEADAYATAFQAMGIENIKQFLKKNPELKVYLIFENDKNELETLIVNNFPLD